MNKKHNPEEVLNKNKTIRFTKREAQIIEKKAKAAGMSFSEFCRQVALKGYVQAVRTAHDMEEIRKFIDLLIENKSALSRMSNLIKNRDPHLVIEMLQLKDQIKEKIEQIQL